MNPQTAGHRNNNKDRYHTCLSSELTVDTELLCITIKTKCELYAKTRDLKSETAQLHDVFHPQEKRLPGPRPGLEPCTSAERYLHQSPKCSQFLRREDPRSVCICYTHSSDVGPRAGEKVKVPKVKQSKVNVRSKQSKEQGPG